MSRASRLRSKRSQQKVHPATIATLIAPPTQPEIGMRAMTRRHDPVFPARVGTIVAVTFEHGATVVKLELDAGIGRPRPRLRKLLADVILLEDWETRRPAPRHEVDANVYLTPFG